MPYTQEQVEQAKGRMKYLVDILHKYGTDRKILSQGAPADNAEGPDLSEEEIDIVIILAVLETAEKERDHWRRERDHEYKYGEEMQFGMEAEYDRAEALASKLEALTAYVSKLEKAGDGMVGCSAADFDKACATWDAARKAKP